MKNIPASTLKSLLEVILKIRSFEEKLIELYPAQNMRTPIHLYIGQEAIAAGVTAHLKKTDYVFSTHRGHGHSIAKGANIKSLLAEFYGRDAGCARGRGGSVHIVAPECGILGTTAIVGGGLPLAAGAALASKLRGDGRITVVFFGDGAADNGVFHETLNMAALKKLPLIFVCENNFYATCSHQNARQPLDNIFKRGSIYGIPGFRGDGTDVEAVYNSSCKAVERARDGDGPTLLEYRAYRWRTHVGPGTDFHMGYRTQEELNWWMERCPVIKFEKKLLNKKIITRKYLEELKKKINAKIEDAVKFGKNAPYPMENTIEDYVY